MRKKAIVIPGRYQPPCKSHGRVVAAAKKEFKRRGDIDAIIVAIIEGKKTSEDKRRNPLTGEQREKYLKASNYMKGVQTVIAPTVMDAFNKIKEQGYDIVTVVGGKSSRKDESNAETYKSLLDKYDPDVKHSAVTVVRDNASDEYADLSGSVVRAAVRHDMFDEFKNWIDIDDEQIVKKLYDDIKKANQ